jgi:hypothetical protein
LLAKEIVPVLVMKAYERIRELEVQLHSFLNSELENGSHQRPLYPEKQPPLPSE